MRCTGDVLKIMLFVKSFLVLLMLALVAFIFLEMDVLLFLKLLAGAVVVSVIFSIAYPEIRGVKGGDTVMIVSSNNPLTLVGRFGKAIDSGRKNSTIKVKLKDGNEMVGIVEEYSGIITPPRVRPIYEERLVERWKP